MLLYLKQPQAKATHNVKSSRRSSLLALSFYILISILRHRYEAYDIYYIEMMMIYSWCISMRLEAYIPPLHFHDSFLYADRAPTIIDFAAALLAQCRLPPALICLICATARH